ncbi:MAG: hypothetical protein QNJ68_15180 [Microcoleaceae cyanobacterium MO_207.B10]|nr:hypothetical protein [Microcoleaceae cyanobacterium MO_207.B10]
MNKKINLLLSTLILTLIISVSLPRVKAQITQTQSNSNTTWGEVFQDFFNQSDEDPPVSHKDGTSRGTLCLVSPGLIEIQGKIWNTRPTFIWQGKLKQIEINEANSEEILWNVELTENDQKVVYTGQALKPGNTYYWQVFDSVANQYSFPLMRVTFIIMDMEERQAITQELEKLNTELNQQGVKPEAIALARAKFFAQRNLFSDALSEAFAVKNPSPKLQDFRSNIWQIFC